MPVYEFYCSACNTLFNFFSARIDTTARPACPRCGRAELDRRPARFATLRHAGEDEPDPLDELDDDRMAGAMEALADELAGAEDEEDPRQLGRLMRRFGEVSGLALGPKMEEMIRRLEAGEDADAVEDEMGDEFGEEGEGLDELFQLRKAITRRRRRPRVDENLYFM
jgi:putative FmdB family regulatory protein